MDILSSTLLQIHIHQRNKKKKSFIFFKCVWDVTDTSQKKHKAGLNKTTCFLLKAIFHYTAVCFKVLHFNSLGVYKPNPNHTDSVIFHGFGWAESWTTIDNLLWIKAERCWYVLKSISALSNSIEKYAGIH